MANHRGADHPADEAGLREMEGEHRVQVGLILALERGAAGGGDPAEVTEIMERLVDYTNVHFLSEQLLMRLNAYPDADAHEQAHDSLIEKVRAIQDGYARGDSHAVAAGLDTLKTQLLDHIRTYDVAFSEFLDDPSVV